MSKDLKTVVCPQCKTPFKLQFRKRWHTEEEKQTLVIFFDEEAVHDVSICCPHCKYEENL